MAFTVVNIAGESVPLGEEPCTNVGQLRKCIAQSLGVHALQLELLSKDAPLKDSVLTADLEGPVTLMQNEFLTTCLVGHWANTDASANGMIGYSLAVSPSGQLRCAGYGKCHPTWSVSVFDATPTGDGFRMEADHGFKTETVVGTLRDSGELIVSEAKVFTDGSGRPSRETEYVMARIPGNLDVMEQHLTSTFYTPSGEPGMFGVGERRELLGEFE